MEIIGKLHEKKDAVQRTATFLVREFVVEVFNQRDPRYNDYLLCQLTGDRCSLLDQYNVGDDVQVTFDLRGRKWTAQDGTVRYMTSLNAWRIDRPGQNQYQQPAPGYPQQGYGQQPVYTQQPAQQYVQPTQPVPPVAPQPTQQPDPAQSPTDDLPF